jgi:hypothetical protein
MVNWHRNSVVLAGILLVACGQLADTGHGSTEDLVLSFGVEPETLYAADALVAILGVMNPTLDTVGVETDGGCLGTVSTADWTGAQQAFTGTADSCTPAPGMMLLIPPGDSISTEWDLVAWLHGSEDGGDSTLPWPGRYTLWLHTPPSLPVTEVHFVLRPSGYYMGWRRCGFRSPSATDSIAVAVDSTELVSAALLIRYKVLNFTSQEIRLMEGGGVGGTVNGVTIVQGQGWLAIESIIEKQTASGWEAVTAPRYLESYPVVLQQSECLQAVTGSLPETGTYRLRVLLQTGDWAYSEPFVVN